MIVQFVGAVNILYTCVIKMMVNVELNVTICCMPNNIYIEYKY